MTSETRTPAGARGEGRPGRGSTLVGIGALILLLAPAPGEAAGPRSADVGGGEIAPAPGTQTSPQETGLDLAGPWQGDLSLGGRHLTIVVRFRREGPGEWSATMDSPDQGNMGIPVDSVVVDGGIVRLHAGEIGGRYEGRIGEEGNALRGRWMQRGRSIPLVLRAVEDAATPRRPQEPEGEVPYRSASVRIAVPGGGVELAGTLAVPDGEGPFPAVLLISGSGAQPRDGDVAGHRPFLVVADRLAHGGVASLRLDDRGTGASAGDLDATPLSRSAEATLGAVRWLSERAPVDPGRVGLLAHSEGGLVASLAALREPESVGFLVLLAPPAVEADSLMAAQHRAIGEAAGLPPPVIREQVRVSRRIFSIVRRVPDRGAALDSIRRAVEEAAREVPEENRRAFRQLMGTSRAAELAYSRMTTPRFRSYLALDPDTVHARVEAPVLALYGGRDLQVLPGQNLAPLAAQLARAPTDDVTIRVMPGLNHLLQTAGSGLPSEYGRIEETIAPEALRTLVDWIEGR